MGMLRKPQRAYAARRTRRLRGGPWLPLALLLWLGSIAPTWAQTSDVTIEVLADPAGNPGSVFTWMIQSGSSMEVVTHEGPVLQMSLPPGEYRLNLARGDDGTWASMDLFVPTGGAAVRSSVTLAPLTAPTPRLSITPFVLSGDPAPAPSWQWRVTDDAGASFTNFATGLPEMELRLPPGTYTIEVTRDGDDGPTVFDVALPVDPATHPVVIPYAPYLPREDGAVARHIPVLRGALSAQSVQVDVAFAATEAPQPGDSLWLVDDGPGGLAALTVDAAGRYDLPLPSGDGFVRGPLRVIYRGAGSFKTLAEIEIGPLP